jgi:adenylate kinase
VSIQARLSKTNVFEKTKDKKVVIATGISGCGRKEYLEEWKKYSFKRGKIVKIFSVGEMIFSHAEEIGLKLDKVNILNVNLDTLQALRSAVLTRVLDEILNTEYDVAVICVHGWFFWKKRLMIGLDRFMNQFQPDMYLTFIDDFRNILARLDSRPQWKEEELSSFEILLWQNAEVELTAILAEFQHKPFFTIPTRQPVSTLYKLIFHPEIEPVYVAMPISHFRDPKDRSRIDRFIRQLDRYFTVFNPLSVEVVGAIDIGNDKKSIKENMPIYHHIVYRDLRWFVRGVKKVIVFWPRPKPPASFSKYKKISAAWPETIPSPGADHETHVAFTEGKDVWVVFLPKKASPFITHYATRLFRSESEFFNFLEKNYPERSNLRW